MSDKDTFWGAFLGGLVGGPLGALVGGVLGAISGNPNPLESFNTEFGAINACFVNHGQFVNGVRGLVVNLTCNYNMGGSILPKSEKYTFICGFMDKNYVFQKAIYPEFAMADGTAIFGSEETIHGGILGFGNSGTLNAAIFIPYGVLNVQGNNSVELFLRAVMIRDSDKVEISRQHYNVEYFLYKDNPRENPYQTNNSSQPPFPFQEAAAITAYLVNNNGNFTQGEMQAICSFFLPQNPSESDVQNLGQIVSQNLLISENQVANCCQVLNSSFTYQMKLEFIGFLAGLTTIFGTPDQLKLGRIKNLGSHLRIESSDLEKLLLSLAIGLNEKVLAIIDLFSVIINLDGKVASEEVKIVKTFFQNLGGDFCDPKVMNSVKEYLKLALKKNNPLDTTCSLMVKNFEPSLRADILKVCYEIAISDGQINQQEKDLLKNISQKLEIFGKQFEDIHNLFCKNLDALFEVLGLRQGASLEDVKSAYREKAKKLHPDKINGMDEQIKKFAEIKFKELNDAYQEILKLYEK